VPTLESLTVIAGEPSRPLAAPATALDPGAPITVGAQTVRFLRDGAMAFPAMLEAIEGAKREVLLEMYWFDADRVGHRFRAALVERARAGVRVALVYDGIGSFYTPRSFWTPLIEAGAEVHEFAPLSPLRRRFRAKRIPFRDHRKILVVDGEIGFAGGINIGELWDPPDDPAGAFRDDAIEIRGPAVRSLRATCLETLRRCGSVLAKDRAGTHSGDPLLRVLTNRTERRASRSIRRAYLLGIRSATRSLDIASAYFLPGPRFLRAMRLAAKRGVRVRVLVPERSDVWIVALAMRSILGRMLADGIEVYTYMPRVLHSKTAIFDGRFTFIGSHNLDALSLTYNLECDVVVDSADFASVVGAAFEDDLAQSHRLDLASWTRRPLLFRAVAWMAALFRAFM
jgi:cardiolipin synthase A/B